MTLAATRLSGLSSSDPFAGAIPSSGGWGGGGGTGAAALAVAVLHPFGQPGRPATSLTSTVSSIAPKIRLAVRTRRERVTEIHSRAGSTMRNRRHH